MQRVLSIVSICFQLITTFLLLFSVYMLLAFLDIDDLSFPGVVGFTIFQPLVGLIVTSLTIIICLIIGIPIRLSKRFNQLWSSNAWICIVLFAVGLGMMLLGLVYRETVITEIDGAEVEKLIPNITLSISGWFAMGFSLLHFYPHKMLFALVRYLDSKFGSYQNAQRLT